MFQRVSGTIGFQTTTVSTIAKRTVRIDTHMFNNAAVHTTSLMNLMIRYDGTTQILVQQKSKGIVQLRMVP